MAVEDILKDHIAVYRNEFRHFKTIDFDRLATIRKPDVNNMDELIGALSILAESLPNRDAMYHLQNVLSRSMFLTDDEIENQLNYIRENCTRIRSVRTNLFKVRSKHIIMEDVVSGESFDFGKFDISMIFGYSTLGENHVKVVPAENNTEKDGMFHPYVNGAYNLCLGDFRKMYEKFASNCRLGDAFDIVLKVLTKYGGDENLGRREGAHSPIAKWVGYECQECGDLRPVDEFVACATSNVRLCEKCVNSGMNIDEHTGYPHLSHFLSVCETCEKRTVGVRTPKGAEKSICTSCRKGN